jgi:RNA polymerase sigma-70 factor (ECF subfamily)
MDARGQEATEIDGITGTQEPTVAQCHSVRARAFRWEQSAAFRKGAREVIHSRASIHLAFEDSTSRMPSIATTLPAFAAGSARPCDNRVRAAVDAHYDALWRFLRRMGVAEANAEDAVQQVLLVFARRAAVVPPDAERAFLFSTALRVASDIRRKAGRSREAEDVEALLSAAHPGPDAEEQLAQHEMLGCLDALLEELAPELRVVLVLAELEEQTLVEIAALLDLPRGTVASRLRRARQLFEVKALELKARLGREDVKDNGATHENVDVEGNIGEK